MSSSRFALALALLTFLGGNAASAQTGPIGAYANIEDSFPDARPRESQPEPTSPPPTMALRGRALRAQVHAELASRRRLNLARFRAYVDRGVYPANTYAPGSRNVLIDASGRVCAAATIMTEDGLGEFVRSLAATNNFLRLSDVHEGPLLGWILESGFTQEELAMIQEPFVDECRDPTWNRPGARVDPEAARFAELARLRRRYATVLTSLVRHERRSLARATARRVAELTRIARS